MALKNFFNELNRDVYVPANKRNGLVSGQFYRTDSIRNGRPERVDPLSMNSVMGGPGGPGVPYGGPRMNGGGSYSGVRMNGMGGFDIGPSGDGFGGAPGNNKNVNRKLMEMSGKSLHEKLAELERMRHRHNLGIALAFLGVAALIIIMLIGGSSPNPFMRILPTLVIIFSTAGVLIYFKVNGHSSNDDFKALYKSVFVEDVLGKKFQNLYYAWKTGFPAMAVSSFNLVRMGNRFKSEDYICATYKDVKFETSDVLIQQHTSTGKSSHTTTYFRGRMFVFYMPRTIQASVRITPDGFMYTPTSNRHLDKLDLENINFNKQYNVYATDPHYAFYLLTPSMMERILYLKGKYGYVILNFEADRVFAAVPITAMRDTFDADMSRAIDYPTDRAKAEAEANVICDLMEVLEAVPRG
ncbi:MAG: DUF3137 domain-containing protein [Eubacterium sp.]|nr:DUF3137 domain-containing protein [Eubacterium sp.]MBR1857791.1 DUF3137 domain-containing protein [Oribacterium sp.]